MTAGMSRRADSHITFERGGINVANFMESMKELQKLRRNAKVIEKQLRAEQLPFASRDGRVKGVINGKLEVLSLDIDPGLLSPDGKKNLERLLAATFNSAVEQMQAKVSQVVSSQMGLNLPGM